jgi:hypothetical protein
MTRVLLDESLRSKLLNLKHPLQLCDDDGQIVGLLTPVPTPCFGEPSISEEELKRIDEEPVYSTDEVISFLEKL